MKLQVEARQARGKFATGWVTFPPKLKSLCQVMDDINSSCASVNSVEEVMSVPTHKQYILAKASLRHHCFGKGIQQELR